MNVYTYYIWYEYNFLMLVETYYYFIGLAERRCNFGTWGEVDVTSCTSQEFNNIILEVHVQLYQFSKTE